MKYRPNLPHPARKRLRSHTTSVTRYDENEHPDPDLPEIQMHTVDVQCSLTRATSDNRILADNGATHTIINEDRSTDHQETGPPHQEEIFIPETAKDRETVTTALLLIMTRAEITGNAADFLEIPRTTVGKTDRICLTQLFKN